MTKTPSGIDAFHANIEAMKQVGRDNDAQREQEARQNTVEHLQTMDQRARAAALLKEQRRLEGERRRNEHNARLQADREKRLAHENDLKGKSLRALAA